MRLHGAEWPHVYNSSGARGFFGEGYWYHRLWKHLGLNYEGSCFVAKTTTLCSRKGNMPLDSEQRPKELVPKCIVVKPLKGVVLNSVGLSGPGADCLIDKWSEAPPDARWMVSFMSVAPTSSERIHEAKLFFEKLQKLIRQCGVMNLGLQINVSCPNVGHVLSELMLEVEHTLDLASDLGIPVLVKVNALLRPGEAIRLTDHPACDGLIVSNSIPWGGLGDKIPWRKLFGTDVSPLANIGGGGLSGAPLLRIVGEWITAAKRLGVKKPIVGGGGILSTDDASYMLDCGADAIEIGSVSILRPWRVQGIIRYVNTRLGYM